MEIKELLKEGEEIWGEKKLSLAQIIVRMGKFLVTFVVGSEIRKGKLIFRKSKLKEQKSRLMPEQLPAGVCTTFRLKVLVKRQP